MSVGNGCNHSNELLRPLGNGATIQTNFSLATLPRTPPADLAAGPQPGALPRIPLGAPPIGPRQGANPHPAKGSAPWNPVSIIRIQLHVWLYECALRTTLTRFKLNA